MNGGGRCAQKYNFGLCNRDSCFMQILEPHIVQPRGRFRVCVCENKTFVFWFAERCGRSRAEWPDVCPLKNKQFKFKFSCSSLDLDIGSFVVPTWPPMLSLRHSNERCSGELH